MTKASIKTQLLNCLGIAEEDYDDEFILKVIKGYLYDLPDADREAVVAAVKELKAVVDKHGVAGILAILLISTEIANENTTIN